MRKAEARRARIGVLMGGWSAEREVSLRTGAAALAALRRLGYRAAAVDAGRDVAAQLAKGRVEVAFLALHGRGGEDGAIQGLLECVGIPYTGSGVLASALAMDKKHSRWLFERAGLPTPRGVVVARRKGARGVAALGLPLVVKPTCEGSSIGMTIVRSRRALAGALALAHRYDPEALVEAFVPGRDLTVGVLGDLPLAAVEMRPRGGFYDYASKYTAGETEYLVPAPVPRRVEARLRSLALAAHRALGCRGASRVDFRLDPRGGLHVLEVNTIPGMTETSLLPKSAAAVGIGFDALVERMLLAAALDGGRRCPAPRRRGGGA